MEKSKLKKIYNYSLNILIVLIILTLFIPSWRIQFQSFTQRLFLGSTTLEKNYSKTIDFHQNEWLIYDQNQKEISFHELKGKPIVLNFWATWCPSCRTELPEIYELKKELGNEVYIISISNESYDVIKKSGEFEKHGDILYYTKEFPLKFEFTAYPTTFFIDYQFKIVSKIEGATKLNTTENINFINSLKE